MPATTSEALAERFARASGRPPLSALSARSSAELTALLGQTEEFEDLPGKWQAALLEAEAGRGEDSASRRCCHGS